MVKIAIDHNESAQRVALKFMSCSCYHVSHQFGICGWWDVHQNYFDIRDLMRGMVRSATPRQQVNVLITRSPLFSEVTRVTPFVDVHAHTSGSLSCRVTV